MSRGPPRDRQNVTVASMIPIGSENVPPAPLPRIRSLGQSTYGKIREQYPPLRIAAKGSLFRYLPQETSAVRQLSLVPDRFLAPSTNNSGLHHPTGFVTAWGAYAFAG